MSEEPKRDPAVDVMRGILMAALVLALIGLAVWGVIAFVDNSNDLGCDMENADRAMDGRPEKDCD